MLSHYIKVTFRELLKYRTQSIISIIGLAIGFTAFILGGYWLWWETHFDNFHPEADRLYCLTTEGLVKRANGTQADLDQLHINDREELFKLLPEIEASCSFNHLSFTLQQGNEAINLLGMESAQSFFNLFQADFIEGTHKGIVPDGSSVILTKRTAHKLFGTTNCIGKEVVLDNNLRPSVAGVIRDYPDNTDLLFDFLLIRIPQPNHVKRMTTYVRLQKNTNMTNVRNKLTLYKSHAEDKWDREQVKNWKINLLTASEVHLRCHPELTDRIRNIHILALAGIMAFLSALINQLVLFIGQQQRKQQKNRTYLCVGASTTSMVMKGFTELAFPLMIAFLIAFCLIESLYPYYESYTAWNRYGIYENVSRHLSRTSLFSNTLSLAGISILIFLFICYYPIRNLLEHKIRKPALFKQSLIVVQIFIGSLFFIISLGLFRQLHFILSKDKGIDYERVIQVDLGYSTAHQTNLSVLKPEMVNHPYIEGVTYTCGNAPVFTEQGDWYGSFYSHFCFDPNESEPNSYNPVVVADKDFFSFFKLQPISGNWPTAANPYSYIVNETCLQTLGYTNLLERPIYIKGQASQAKVCCVIKDYFYAPMQYPILPLFFTTYDNPTVKDFERPYLIYVRYAKGHKKEVLEHLREITSHIQNDNVNRNKMFTELSDLVDLFNRPEKVIFTIFSILSLVCILISTFGIYSLVSLATEQRRKEIAIRKVNGATFYHILQLFFREYFMLVALGNAFALPVGYLVTKRWLETYANHTTLPAWLFLLVFFFTSGIVLLSIFRQVKRAATTNPAEIIKTE